jgi:DNA-binding MarR family transcriptional regulator
METISRSDYESLAELRYQIRRFLHFSEQAARKAGMEPRQHQFLLAVKGLPAGARPLVGTLAERLQIQHHSAVELTDRLARGGFIRRDRDVKDGRQVLLSLTAKGEKVLRELSLAHKSELRTAGPVLQASLSRVLRATGKSGKARPHTKKD